MDHICWIDDTYCNDCGPITTELADCEPAWSSFVDYFRDKFDIEHYRQKEEA